MRSVINWIDKILAQALIILMAVMVLDVSWQVFTRFVIRRPSSYTEELATFLLIWIGLLGASYALRTKSHLGIDILTYRLSGARKYTSEILIYTCVLAFALSVMVFGGIRLVNLTFQLNQVSAAVGIKMGYVYLVIPMTGVLIMLYSLVFIVDALLLWHGREPLSERRELEKVTAGIE